MPEVEVIPEEPVVAEEPLTVVSPLEGDVVTAFSMDQLLYNETLEDWRTHDGVDIAAPEGSSIMAASPGTVVAVDEDALMGTTVVIEHDGGYHTLYANLQSPATVEVGETVSAGQVIGTVGTTATAESAQGPHLHIFRHQGRGAGGPGQLFETLRAGGWTSPHDRGNQGPGVLRRGPGLYRFKRPPSAARKVSGAATLPFYITPHTHSH